MLVITRKPQERILFPDFATAVEIVSIKGGKVRLGIEAPQRVTILREEIADATPPAEIARVQEALLAGSPQFRTFKHAIRNRVNAAALGITLARRQLQVERPGEAEQSLDIVSQEFEKIRDTLEDMDRLGDSPPTGPAPDKRSARRVLLVEDDANECGLLAGFLRHAGLEVTTAHDGVDALEVLARTDRPDVVLMDMALPRCDGPTAISRIRQQPQLRSLRIFAVSGRPRSEFAEQAERLEIDGWFRKPLDPQALLANLTEDLAV
ncbi:MAG: response regulator [Planctomycetaceae bacterium]